VKVAVTLFGRPLFRRATRDGREFQHALGHAPSLAPVAGEKFACEGLIRTLQGNKNAVVKILDEYIRDDARVIASNSQLCPKLVHFLDKPFLYRVGRTPASTLKRLFHKGMTCRIG